MKPKTAKIIKEYIEIPTSKGKKKSKKAKTTQKVVNVSDDAISADLMLQTLFFPQTGGIHRGMAQGTETTAITYWKTSTDIVVNGATTSAFTFALVPTRLETAQWFTGKGGATLTDPFATPTVTLAGFFLGNNPSTSYRVISCRMRILPQSTALTQGGTIFLAYVPDLINGPTPNPIFTRPNMDILEMSSAFTGLETPLFQWFPSDTETELEAAAFYTQGNTTVSGAAGYIIPPAGGSVTYRFDFEVGVEYVPTVTFRPFVDRQPADIKPTASYYVTKFVQKNWRDCVISTWTTYLEQAMARRMSSPGYTRMYAHVSNAGLPSVGPDGGNVSRNLGKEQRIQDWGKGREGLPEYKEDYDVLTRMTGMPVNTLVRTAEKFGRVADMLVA